MFEKCEGYWYTPKNKTGANGIYFVLHYLHKLPIYITFFLLSPCLKCMDTWICIHFRKCCTYNLSTCFKSLFTHLVWSVVWWILREYFYTHSIKNPLLSMTRTMMLFNEMDYKGILTIPTTKYIIQLIRKKMFWVGFFSSAFTLNPMRFRTLQKQFACKVC